MTEKFIKVGDEYVSENDLRDLDRDGGLGLRPSLKKTKEGELKAAEQKELDKATSVTVDLAMKAIGDNSELS